MRRDLRLDLVAEGDWLLPPPPKMAHFLWGLAFVANRRLRGVVGWNLFTAISDANCKGDLWETQNSSGAIAHHDWTCPSGHLIGKSNLAPKLEGQKMVWQWDPTSSLFPSQLAICTKSAANEAFGCWSSSVGQIHRVHSGASIASLKPMKRSNKARGLCCSKSIVEAAGAARAVMNKVCVWGWFKPAELRGVYSKPNQN